MLGVLDGGPMLQGQSAADAIAELSKAFPNPTNAQALAVLVAAFEIPEVKPGDPKTKWTEAWSAPYGVLPRMRLAACGWTKKGDTLKAADDAAWWAAPYKLGPPVSLPLASVWTALATYAKWVEANVKDVSWTLTPDLFTGDSSAIATELVNVADDLSRLAGAKADTCTPYIVAFKPDAQPIMNPPCLTSIGDKAGPIRPVLDFNRKAKEIGLFFLVMYILSKLPD